MISNVYRNISKEGRSLDIKSNGILNNYGFNKKRVFHIFSKSKFLTQGPSLSSWPSVWAVAFVSPWALWAIEYEICVEIIQVTYKINILHWILVKKSIIGVFCWNKSKRNQIASKLCKSIFKYEVVILTNSRPRLMLVL